MQEREQFYKFLDNMTQEERVVYVAESNKQIIALDNVVQNSIKTSQNAIYDCLHDDCDNNTQTYCHLMQKNGVLSNITFDNHLFQMQISNPHKWLGEITDVFEMRKIGINQVFSGKLFCDKHDTELFKKFEVNVPDYDDYETQLLMCYRTMCYELWQNYYNIKFSEESAKGFTNLLDNINLDNRLPIKIIQEKLNEIHKRISQEKNKITTTSINIKYVQQIGKHFSSALLNINNQAMKFVCRKIKQLPISASMMLSSEKYFKDQQNNYPYFVQVIPQIDKSYIIFGYFHELFDEWLDSYYHRFLTFKENELLTELTRLITTRNLTWCVSPNFYNNLTEQIKQKIKDDYIEYYENKFDDEYWYKNNVWSLFI